MKTTMAKYRIQASFERDEQILDCSQAEVLGDAYGRTYATEAEAQDVADDLQDAVGEFDLDPTTHYHVHVVRV